MSQSLKPWFAVAIPHEDIREGRLSEAVFAANLWAVVQRSAPEVYLSTEAFFAKTYLTTGLANVLKKAARALSGQADMGDRIISLQTSFGGGKTHALVALWHLARHADVIRQAPACADLRAVLGNQLPERVNAVAVFNNQTCDATQGRRTPDGIHIRTMWGELAYQLGGASLYAEIAENDQNRSVPQGLFTAVLQKVAPCLILLDEVADYCVGASAVKVGSATLADQTISFVQQLSDAVNNVPGVALVATLPASHMEIAASERGQDILQGLEKRFGRMSADVKPVSDDEIYEVVRRRLFESLGDPSEHMQVADAYMRMYQQHHSEVPPEAIRATYRERIVGAYPFHPVLIDALYLRWGSHGDFQRTRGVLRLLASVVGNLWQRRQTETQSQPLIQPCHVQWTIDAMQAALTRLWGAAYESVVAADVIGEKANARLLDEQRGSDYVNGRITQGLAASILLGSFGMQAERAGYSNRDLKLCVSRPDLNWGYTDGALLALEERSFFLRNASIGEAGKRYWFGTRPTLVKLLAQYRGQLAAQDFDQAIIDTTQEEVNKARLEPATWHVLVNPEADLPEQKSLTLLVMAPGDAVSDDGRNGTLEQRLMKLSAKCGSRERTYRNTLLFLLPSQRGLTRLRNTLIEVAALEAVKRDFSDQLDREQREDLNGRLDAARKAVVESTGTSYTNVARIEGQQVSLLALSGVQPKLSDHLQAVWKHLVDEEEWILQKVGQLTLQRVGLVPSKPGEETKVRDAVETFLRMTDKPMIAIRQAVTDGLREACKDQVIGIGRGLSLSNLQRRWCGERVTLDPNEDGVWIILPFMPEPPPTSTGGGSGTATSGGTGTPTGGGTTTKPDSGGQSPGTTGAGTQPPPETSESRRVRRITISGVLSPENWAELYRCFIVPAARLNTKRVRFRIDLAPEGQPVDVNDPALKSMKEAARQLELGLTFEE